MEATLENPLYVRNPTYHTNHFTLATFHQLMANSGSWLQFSREGLTDTWQTGMDSDSPYVVRVSNSTCCNCKSKWQCCFHRKFRHTKDNSEQTKQ